jgi:hypothetical protein
VVVAVLLTTGAGIASATEVGYGRKFGLGLALGDPTGLTGKWWISSTNAIDFGIGFTNYGWGRCYDDDGRRRCYGYRDTSVNVDYLWQSNLVRGAAQLDWHIGVGGRLYFWGDRYYENGLDFAVRAPIGLDLMFNNPSFIEVYFELAPALHLVDFIGLVIEGGIGIRFYF